MQNQMISIRRSVERKVPGYVKVIAFLLYAAALLFTILGAMFGILFLPLALGSLFGGWYLMGEARVIYEYRLDGKMLTVMRKMCIRDSRYIRAQRVFMLPPTEMNSVISSSR